MASALLFSAVRRVGSQHRYPLLTSFASSRRWTHALGAAVSSSPSITYTHEEKHDLSPSSLHLEEAVTSLGLGTYRVKTTAAVGHVTRSQPSTSGERVGMLRNGQVVEVLETRQDDDGSLWFKFQHKGANQPLWSLAHRNGVTFFSPASTPLEEATPIYETSLLSESAHETEGNKVEEQQYFFRNSKTGEVVLLQEKPFKVGFLSKPSSATQSPTETAAIAQEPSSTSEMQPETDPLEKFAMSMGTWSDDVSKDSSVSSEMNQVAEAPLASSTVEERPNSRPEPPSDDVLRKLASRDILYFIQEYGTSYFSLQKQLICMSSLSDECERVGYAAKESVVSSPEFRLLVSDLAKQVSTLSTDELAILSNHLEKIFMRIKPVKEYSVETYKQRESIQQQTKDMLLASESVQGLLGEVAREMLAREDLATKHVVCVLYAAALWGNVPLGPMLDKTLSLIALQVDTLPFLVIQRLFDSFEHMENVTVGNVVVEQLVSMLSKHLDKGLIPPAEFIRPMRRLSQLGEQSALIPFVSQLLIRLIAGLDNLPTAKLSQLAEGLANAQINARVIPEAAMFFERFLALVAARNSEFKAEQMAVLVASLQRLDLTVPDQTISRLDPVAHVSYMMRTSGVLKAGGSGYRERVLSRAGEFIFQKSNLFPSSAVGRKMQLDNLRLTHVREGEESTRQRILKKQTELKEMAERKAAELRALDCLVSCIEILHTTPKDASDVYRSTRTTMADKVRVFYRNNMTSSDSGWGMMPYLMNEIISCLSSLDDRVGIVSLLNVIERYGMNLEISKAISESIAGVEGRQRFKFSGLPKFNEAELRDRARRVRLELQCTREAVAQYPVVTLKACLKQLGLPVSGKKSELIDRIISCPKFQVSMLEEVSRDQVTDAPQAAVAQ